jgi:four helix bundle protein
MREAGMIEPGKGGTGEPGNMRKGQPVVGRMGEPGKLIESFRELRVYQGAMDAAMKVFEATKTFPPEEKYAMVDQIRRSSRSVCANLAEAWRKRRYPAAFVAKLNDAESEACETQVWIEFARKCRYLESSTSTELDRVYDRLIAQMVRMIDESPKWLIK